MATSVELNMAALEKLLPQHGSTALDTRLGTTDAESETISHLLLGESVEFGECERFAIPGGERVDEVQQEGSELLFGDGDVGFDDGGWLVERRLGTLLAVVINDRVVSDAIQPRCQMSLVLERPNALVNLDKNILKDVIGVLRRSGTGSDVGVEPCAERRPNVFGRHCHAWDSRLAESLLA
jgi:hypothetical protein